MSSGVSQDLAHNVVYIYTHTHTRGESAQQTLSVGHERCGYLLSGTKGLLCILGNVGLEARPAASGRPTALETSFLRLRDSSTHPPLKKIVFLE